MARFSDDMKLLNVLSSLEKENLGKGEKEKLESEKNELLKDIDRINIRECFSNQLADYMELLLKYNNEDFQFEDSEIQMDTAINLNLFDVEFAINFYKLIPPFVKQGVNIPEKVRNLYAESRYCFVFRQYCASIVLSRAIIEMALKIKLNIPEEEYCKITDLINMAKERNYLNGEMVWTAKKVISKANNILHQSKPFALQESLNAINETKEVLEYLFD